jgi:hypothetical protein
MANDAALFPSYLIRALMMLRFISFKFRLVLVKPARWLYGHSLFAAHGSSTNFRSDNDEQPKDDAFHRASPT